MCTLESEKLIKSTDGVQFGYIMPGHGFKGKQQLVDSDADVATMYDSYKKKTPIIIWAKIKAHARKYLSISDVNSGVPPKKKKPEEDKTNLPVIQVTKAICRKWLKLTLYILLMS